MEFSKKMHVEESMGTVVAHNLDQVPGQQQSMNQLVKFASTVCFGQLFRRALSKAP